MSSPATGGGIICTVCKRKFADEAKLERHNQLSDLHKSNVQALREEKIALLLANHNNNNGGHDDDRNSSSLSHSTFATQSSLKRKAEDEVERGGNNHNTDNDNNSNKKFKASNEEGCSSSNAIYLENGSSQEEPYRAIPNLQAFPTAATSDFATRMMAKMGWRGGGLGKEEKGRLEPVQVNMQPEGVGLGATPVKEEFVVLPSDNFQEATKKRLLDRMDRDPVSWTTKFQI